MCTWLNGKSHYDGGWEKRIEEIFTQKQWRDRKKSLRLMSHFVEHFRSLQSSFSFPPSLNFVSFSRWLSSDFPFSLVFPPAISLFSHFLQKQQLWKSNVFVVLSRNVEEEKNLSELLLYEDSPEKKKQKRLTGWWRRENFRLWFLRRELITIRKATRDDVVDGNVLLLSFRLITVWWH